MTSTRRPRADIVRNPPPSDVDRAPSDVVRTLFRTVFDGLFVVDDSRRLLRVNEPAARLLGVPTDQIVDRRIEDYTPSELWPLLQRLWNRFTEQGTLRGRYEILRSDRSRGLVEYRAARNFRPGEHLIAAREIGPPQLGAASARSDPRGGVQALTPREREVLQLAADGRRTQDIAELLILSPRTVKTHFEHAYEKLGVRDRATAVAECLRRGLID
jgi:PAS domain S-box-containing protein